MSKKVIDVSIVSFMTGMEAVLMSRICVKQD